MWSEQLSSGNVRFCERFQNPYTGKTIKLSITLSKDTAATRKQASNLLQERFLAKINQKKTSLTLGDLVDDYLKYQKEMVKASSYRSGKTRLTAMLNILGRETTVNSLNAGYIKKSLLDSGKENAYLNNVLSKTKAVIRWAYQHDYIDEVQFIDKLKPFPDVSKKEKISDKFLESEEVTAIIDELRRRGLINHALFTEMLVKTGLRIGELIALEKSDIDLIERVIHVNKTYDRVNDLVTTPKTLESIRDIPLTDDLVNLIKEIDKFYLNQKAIKFGTNLLFMSGVGNHYIYPTYHLALINTTKKLGITKKVTPHIFRHTYASLLMEKGVPIETISHLLGHSNSKITQEIYLHITNKLKEREFELIRNIKVL